MPPRKFRAWSKESSSQLTALKAATPPAEDPTSTAVESSELLLRTDVKVSLRETAAASTEKGLRRYIATRPDYSPENMRLMTRCRRGLLVRDSRRRRLLGRYGDHKYCIVSPFHGEPCCDVVRPPCQRCKSMLKFSMRHDLSLLSPKHEVQQAHSASSTKARSTTGTELTLGRAARETAARRPWTRCPAGTCPGCSRVRKPCCTCCTEGSPSCLLTATHTLPKFRAIHPK